jgi:hypothetical protein
LIPKFAHWISCLKSDRESRGFFVQIFHRIHLREGRRLYRLAVKRAMVIAQLRVMRKEYNLTLKEPGTTTEGENG